MRAGSSVLRLQDAQHATHERAAHDVDLSEAHDGDLVLAVEPSRGSPRRPLSIVGTATTEPAPGLNTAPRFSDRVLVTCPPPELSVVSA